MCRSRLQKRAASFLHCRCERTHRRARTREAVESVDKDRSRSTPCAPSTYLVEAARFWSGFAIPKTTAPLRRGFFRWVSPTSAARYAAGAICATCPWRRTVYHRCMDEFASLNESFAFALIAVPLLMAIWGCAIVAIDHWVWAGRSDLLPRPGWDGGHEIAPRGDETRHATTVEQAPINN
jgi:hypothetical protein